MKTNPESVKGRLEIARKAKLAKYRRDHHMRADGWVEPENRLAVAERLCRHRVRRIELPKFGSPVVLSETDKADCLQAGLSACVTGRFFEHGMVTKELTQAIRRAMEGRSCLRRDCIWETGTGTPEILAAEVGFISDDETTERRLTRAQRDAARDVLRDLRAARAADDSRKAASVHAGHRAFFLETLGHLTGRTPRERSGNSFSQRARRFADYLKTGWRANAATRPAIRDVWGLEAAFESNFVTA